MKRAALYMRVSTVDQHPETQLVDLRQMAAQRGYQIVNEYTDRLSGTKTKRPGLDQMMTDARRGRFDVVLVWASDRIARSVKHFLDVLDELNRIGVEYVSFRENIDTAGPLGRAIVVIIGAIAELERSLIVERVRAGMRRARLEGQHIGRHALVLDSAAIQQDRQRGQSISERSPRAIAFRRPRCNAYSASTLQPPGSMPHVTPSRLPSRHRSPGCPYICIRPPSGIHPCWHLRSPPSSQPNPRQHPKYRKLAAAAAPRSLRRPQANKRRDQRGLKTHPLNFTKQMAGSARSGCIKSCRLWNGCDHGGFLNARMTNAFRKATTKGREAQVRSRLMTGPQGTTALFIDADNVPISCLATILDLLSSEWTPIKIRAYGTQLLQRYPPLREIGVMPVEVIPVVPGKNAVDLVLTVDAMEELYSGHADSISIASGDSDFTHLIMKIRESGTPVLAFGHLLTPVALQKAATNFYFVEPGLDSSLIRSMRARLLADNVRLSPNLNRDELLKFRLNQLIEEMRRTKERARLAELSAMLKLIHPHFSPKAYGSASLTKLLKQLGFHLEPILGQDGRIQDYELASDS